MTLCKKVNFGHLQLVKYDVLEKGVKIKKKNRMFSFP